MRITQNYMTRSYMGSLNRTVSQLAGSNNRLTTGRKYNRVSEDPAAFARAFRVREQMQENSDYTNRVRDGRNELAAAESNMRAISTIVSSAQENLMRSASGGVSPEQREILAGELDNLQDEVLQLMNAKFGDRFLFSGSSNSKEPFEFKDVGGKKELFYNGVNVKTATGKADFNEDVKVFVDIGLGMKMENGKTNPESGFQISTSGIDMLGFGSTAMGGENVSNNILAMLGDAAEAVRSGDTNLMMEIHDHMAEENKNLLISITDLGNRDQFLEYNQDKLSQDEVNLKSAQKDLEAVSLEEESIYNKMYEMAWTASLQLGSKIIPPSIFDFMR